jgi:hypothetical protein
MTFDDLYLSCQYRLQAKTVSMGYVLIVLLIALSSVTSKAQIGRPIGKPTPTKKPVSTTVRKKYKEPPVQRHNLYIDAATPLSYGCPGGSLTYYYKNTHYLGIGLGVQGYSFRNEDYNLGQFVPAVFGDFRLVCRPLKKNQFFFALDLGANFYKHGGSLHSHNRSYKLLSDYGFYWGHEFGYFRRMTKHGGGPYVMLKMITNSYKLQEYNPNTGQLGRETGSFDSITSLSFGFKF